MNRREVFTIMGAGTAGLTLGGGNADARDHTGDGKSMKSPMDNFHAYLCAFHTAKKDPNIVIEAHHYCCPVTESGDVHQCVIFDKSGKGAKILGVEYIISDKLYQGLSIAEKKYYHPHAYEVISGLLVAPGTPPEAEKKFMEGLVRTWGKTWHTWPDPMSALPMGEPLLMWSATKDGMIGKQLLDARDAQFGISTDAIRKSRSYIGPVPQVEPPASMDSLGRQFTNDGPDEPPKR